MANQVLLSGLCCHALLCGFLILSYKYVDEWLLILINLACLPAYFFCVAIAKKVIFID